jgi:hypothetical protein
MSRTTEALVVAVYAGIVTVPALIAFIYLVIGIQASGNHVGILILLSLGSMISTFVVAWLHLGKSGLTTYRAGAIVGIFAGLAFYIFWIGIFGVIPSLVAAMDYRLSEAWQYFAATFWIVIAESRGIPILVGLLGGLGYIALKQRLSTGNS